ncbi:head maturation protease [Shewanella phage FishSpeaker]|nr:head maturation protease [Shewanella phage FishSpeaker]
MASANRIVTVGNNLLAGSGKRGVLRPIDDDSPFPYYKLRAGGFNIKNRVGITYTLNEYIKECSREGSDFHRRVTMGQMFGELGHPKQYYLEKKNGQVVRTQITDVFEWIMRLKTIDESNVAMHIRKVHFIFTGGDRDPVFNDIEVCGHGPWKDVFNSAMENPDINGAVSIRTVTKPQAPGATEREVDYWSAYDLVLEQGMLDACKHLQAGLESLITSPFVSLTNDGIEVSADSLIDLCERELNNVVNIERYQGNESFISLQGLIETLKSNEYYNAHKGTTHRFKGVSGLEAFL